VSFTALKRKVAGAAITIRRGRLGHQIGEILISVNRRAERPSRVIFTIKIQYYVRYSSWSDSSTARTIEFHEVLSYIPRVGV